MVTITAPDPTSWQTWLLYKQYYGFRSLLTIDSYHSFKSILRHIGITNADNSEDSMAMASKMKTMDRKLVFVLIVSTKRERERERD